MKYSYLYPKNWPILLLITVAQLLAHLPLRLQFYLGQQLGKGFYHLGSKRRQITQTNIALCFPELDAHEQNQLVKKIFRSTGISTMETAMAWFRPPALYIDRMHITGLELLKAAQKEGRGVLLIGAHFATLDMAGALLGSVAQLDVIYRKNKNPLIERLMLAGRAPYFEQVIERKDARKILRRIQQGATIWYAADQDYGRKHSTFAPFFGVSAATITATSRLANYRQSKVLFISHFRDPEDMTWSLHIKNIPGYPSGDENKDAITINGIIESEIRRHPEQYLWLHRRFKTRPEGESRPYK